ncbi:MAG: sensor histidine kinase, partial [Bryobacteraceae bacterium]
MKASQEFLTRMLVSTINAREEESSRVSKTLHDEVGQVLSAVGLQLEAMKLEFRERVPEIVNRANEVQEMLEQAVKQVRMLSYDLNPAMVERAGLHGALERLVERCRDRFGGSIRFVFDSSIRAPFEVGNAWYKIAEHALENALQHSKATRITVHVKPVPGSMMLEIRDNGIGFDISEESTSLPGLGLLLMKHYAKHASMRMS